jgi:hypothetical protein
MEKGPDDAAHELMQRWTPDKALRYYHKLVVGAPPLTEIQSVFRAIAGLHYGHGITAAKSAPHYCRRVISVLGVIFS